MTTRAATEVEAAALVEQCLHTGRPDWESVDFDLPCSRCGYDLRRLPEPRCPECGLTFAWADVFDARLRSSRFLFEHHWRKRPLWSWFRTTAAGLRPLRFWRGVSLHDRVHAGPLVALFVSSALVSIIVVQAVSAGLWLISTGGLALLGDAGYVYFALGELLTEVRGLWSLMAWGPLGEPVAYAVGLVLLGFYGLAAAALLCGLRQTLGRCRVRTVQVFRVLAYSATPVCLVWGGGVPLVPALFLLLENLGLSGIMPPVSVVVLLIMPHVIFTLYVGCGLHYYLRLPRAWLLAVTASFVGQLFAYTMVFAGTRALGWPA